MPSCVEPKISPADYTTVLNSVRSAYVFVIISDNIFKYPYVFLTPKLKLLRLSLTSSSSSIISLKLNSSSRKVITSSYHPNFSLT